MSITIRWDITNMCNLHCAHCSSSDNNPNHLRELTSKQIKGVIDKLKSLPIHSIKLLGGEPSLRKDIHEIIHYIWQSGIPCGITTNGQNLENLNMEDLIKNKKIKYITFSLDGPNDSINSYTRGPGTFSKVLDSINKIDAFCEKYNSPLIKACITVLHRKNILVISDMLKLAVNLKIKKIALMPLIPAGRGARIRNLVCNIEDLMKLVYPLAVLHNKLKDTLTIEPSFAPALTMDYCLLKYNLKFPKTNYKCRAGTELAYIDAYGRLFPCETLRYSAHSVVNREIDLTESTFHSIWSRPEYNRIFELSEGNDYYEKLKPCNQCPHLQKICYPCPEGSRKNRLCSLYIEEQPKLKEIFIDDEKAI